MCPVDVSAARRLGFEDGGRQPVAPSYGGLDDGLTHSKGHWAGHDVSIAATKAESIPGFARDRARAYLPMLLLMATALALASTARLIDLPVPVTTMNRLRLTGAFRATAYRSKSSKPRPLR